MEEFFKMSLLDELFESRCDGFERKLMKRKEAGEEHLDEIMDSFKKILKKVNDDKEISDELDKIYMKILAYSTWMNKQYYKFGIIEGCKLYQELKGFMKEIPQKEYQDKFFEYYNTDFSEFFDRYKIDVLMKRDDYKNSQKEIHDILEKYPKIRSLLEDDIITSFNEEEIKALLRVIRLEDDKSTIEIIHSFKLGLRE